MGYEPTTFRDLQSDALTTDVLETLVTKGQFLGLTGTALREYTAKY